MLVWGQPPSAVRPGVARWLNRIFRYHLHMPPPDQSRILTFEDARRVVEEHASQASPSEKETVDLLHSAGRILAEPFAADRDLPPFPRSTRDGYAVQASDLTTLPARLKILGEIKAGIVYKETL